MNRVRGWLTACLVTVAAVVVCTVTATSEQQNAASAPDFWMKDCATDNGTQPSACASFFWGAPDVTVENHDGPGSDMVWTGGFNRLKTVVRNRGGNDNTACRVFAYEQKAGAGMHWACTSNVIQRIYDAQGSYLCQQSGLCNIGVPDNEYVDHDVPSSSSGVPYEWYWQYPTDIIDPSQHWCLGFVIHPVCEPLRFPPGQSSDMQSSYEVVPDNNVAQINMQELYARSNGGALVSIYAPTALDTIKTKLRAWNTTGSTTAIGFTMDTSGLHPGWSATWSPTSPQVIPNDSFVVVSLSIIPAANPAHNDSSYIDFRTFRLVAPSVILGGVHVIARADTRRPNPVTDLHSYCGPGDSTCCPPWLAPWCAQLSTLDYFAPLEWSVPLTDTAGTAERVMFFYVCRSEGNPNVDLTDKMDSVAVDLSMAYPKFQYLDARQPTSIVDSVYYRVYAVDPAYRISNVGNRISVPLCRWLASAPAQPTNPHPSDNATNIDINTNLIWNAGGNLALHADFNNKTLNAPIGTGGAAVGEPVSVGGEVTAIVRSAPSGSPALEVKDNSPCCAGAAWFEFLGGAEYTLGRVLIQADVWFSELSDCYVGVREHGGASRTFADIDFGSDGNVRFYDAAGVARSAIPYSTGHTIPLLIDFDMNARTYDVWLDGVQVINDRSHGINDRGVGSVLFGANNDPDLTGRMFVDNVHVTCDKMCPVTYDVQFGTTNPPTTLLCNDAVVPVCDPGTLALGNTYYWRVTAQRGGHVSAGPVWRFATPTPPAPCDRATIGITYWDEQTRGTDLRRVAAGDATSTCVHFAWTSADNAENLPNGRLIAYEAWDIGHGIPASTTFIVENRPQYPSLSVDGENLAGLSFMDREDPALPYSVWSAKFPIPCGSLSLISSPGFASGELLYPVHEVGGAGNIVHVLAARANSSASCPSGCYDLLYFRYDPAGGIWSGPVLIAPVDKLAYTIVASKTSNKVAIAYLTPKTSGSPAQGNVAYLESVNGGLTWPASPTIVTSYSACTAGDYSICERGENDITAAYDNADKLHIVWPTRWTMGILLDIITWSDLWHWSSATGTINKIVQGDDASVSSLSDGDLTLAKPSLGVGNGDIQCEDASSNLDYLYVVYTKFGGQTLPERNDLSAKGFLNGELYFTRSKDHGQTWTPPTNLTNTRTPGCDPALGSPCQSEHWASIAREVGNRANITYIDDHDAGAAVAGDGSWTANEVIYNPICSALAAPCLPQLPGLDLNCLRYLTQENLAKFQDCIRRRGRFVPVLPGEKAAGSANSTAFIEADTLRLNNTGTAPLTATVSVEYTLPPSPPQWLTVNGSLNALLTIPPGGEGDYEMRWRNDLPVDTYLATVSVYYTDGTGPHQFDFDASLEITPRPVRFLADIDTSVAPGDSFVTRISVDDPTITLTPPSLRALRLPATASFQSNGDGTGVFRYQRPTGMAFSMSPPASDTAIIEAYTLAGPADTTSDTMLVVLGSSCSCPCKFDPHCDGVVSDVLDVVETINRAFRGTAGTTDPGCPHERTDIDNSGATDVLDVSDVINVAFRGMTTTAAHYKDPCSP